VGIGRQRPLRAARAASRPDGAGVASQRAANKLAKRPPGGIYVEFMRAASAVTIQSSLEPLDALEDRMLAWLASEIHSGHQLSVRQVMGHREFGAPATIHSRLKAMRLKGWITLGDTDDARRKRIVLTPATCRYFERLGRTMAKAVKTQPG
jgi:hypothetical protein